MDQLLSLKTSEELVLLAQSGDNAAFETLANRYRGYAISTIRGRVSENEIEDVAQEAMVRAWEKLSSLKDPQAFPAWLRVLANNICRGWNRRSRERCISLDEGIPEAIHPGPDPLDAVLRWEQSVALRDALLIISQANRRALIMHLWGHYAYSEIAEQLGIPLTTVEGRIHRAKNQLRRLLGYFEPAKPAYSANKGVSAMDSVRPEFVPQLGHSNCVLAIAISPDGKRMATVDNSPCLIIWDVKTGIQERRFSLRGQGNWPILCFSPNSRLLAVAEYAGNTDVWDIEQGVKLSTLEINAQQLAFSPDSNTMWTLSRTPALEEGEWTRTNAFCWDIETGNVVTRVENLLGDGKSFSPDMTQVVTVNGRPERDKYVLVSLQEPELIVWDLSSAKEIGRLHDLDDFPSRLTHSNDGCFVAAIAGCKETPHRILIWNTSTGEVVHSLEGHQELVNDIAFSPDGNTLASGSWDGQVIIWHTHSGKILKRLENNGLVPALAFTPDGNGLFTSRSEAKKAYAGRGIVTLWDLEKQEIKQTYGPHIDGITTLSVTSDRATLVTGGFRSTLHLWRKGRIETVVPIPDHGWTIATAIDPSGKQIATGISASSVISVLGKGAGRILVTESATGTSRQLDEQHEDLVFGIAFDASGNKAASCSRDGSIFVWDAAIWKIIKRFCYPDGWQCGVSTAFSPDGNFLLTTGFEQTKNFAAKQGELTVWDLEKTEAIQRWTHDVGFGAALFTRDGRHVAAGIAHHGPRQANRSEIRLFNISTGEQIRHFVAPGLMGTITGVALSPDESLIAGSTNDRSIVIWSVKTGRVRRSFKVTGWITGILFSQDGRSLISATGDGLMKSWDISRLLSRNAPEESVTLAALSGGTDWIAYNPEGDYDCSPGAEKHIMWRSDAKLYGAEKFAEKYRRPDAIKRILQSIA